MPPTGDLAHNPGVYPDWESNQRPFGSQAGAQSTEPQQPGQNLMISTVLRGREQGSYGIGWETFPFISFVPLEFQILGWPKSPLTFLLYDGSMRA